MVELRKAADIAPNTMTRIRKNEEVSLDVLGRICRILHSDFGDIMAYVEEKGDWDICHQRKKQG
jgi:DNA-binding Xre family transcriptional regulator